MHSLLSENYKQDGLESRVSSISRWWKVVLVPYSHIARNGSRKPPEYTTAFSPTSTGRDAAGSQFNPSRVGCRSKTWARIVWLWPVTRPACGMLWLKCVFFIIIHCTCIGGRFADSRALSKVSRKYPRDELGFGSDNSNIGFVLLSDAVYHAALLHSVIMWCTGSDTTIVWSIFRLYLLECLKFFSFVTQSFCRVSCHIVCHIVRP